MPSMVKLLAESIKQPNASTLEPGVESGHWSISFVTPSLSSSFASAAWTPQISKAQLTMAPVSSAPLSVTVNVQSPNDTVLFKLDKGTCGIYSPVKGAEPSVIAVMASSLKIVFE